MISLGYYIHNIDPFIIRFGSDCFVEGIKWYGVCYILSFILASFLLNLYTKKNISPMSCDENSSLMFLIIIGVLAGGRLGYILLYTPHVFLTSPIEIFTIWHGGMSSHGGFIGVALGIFIFCKRNKFKVLEIGDLVSTIAPIGFFIGRIANFINGELFGNITNVPWGIIFPNSAQWASDITMIPARHPSQLYESLLEGALLFVYLQNQLWNRKSKEHGVITSKFLIAYGILRILTECFREPDAPLICNMSRGQFYSIFLIIGGFILLLIPKRNHIANNIG